MISKFRVIPTFLLSERMFVKTEKFENPIYLGDPINLIRIFNDKFVDEICILNISKKTNDINFSYLKDVFSECFLPLSYGGKIKNIQDVRNIFKIGVDKIIFSTNLFKNIKLVKDAVSEVGSQGISGCINIVQKNDEYSIYLPETSEKICFNNVIEKIQEVEKFGLGELIINFVSRDGMRVGYDYNFIDKISKKIDIPIIALGGASSKEDFNKVVKAGANAAAASSIFVFIGNRKGVVPSYKK